MTDRDYQRKWRAAHPGYMAEYSRKYRAKDRERSNAEKKKWRDENKEKMRVYWANRRARKRAAYVESVNVEWLKLRDSHYCGICGLTVYEDFSIDHIVPLSKGGKHSYENTQLTHLICNVRKGDKCDPSIVYSSSVVEGSPFQVIQWQPRSESQRKRQPSLR